MTTAAQQLAARLKAFNDELIRFVQSLDADDWQKICAGENWPINVVARHIGVSHYRAVDLAKLVAAGQPLPDFTYAQIDAMNKDHAAKHIQCTKEEVLDILHKQGAAMVDHVSGLDDAALNRTATVAAMGGAFSAKQILEAMVIQSGTEHLESMKRAAGV